MNASKNTTNTMHKLHSIQVYINTPKNCKGKIDKKSAENSQKIHRKSAIITKKSGDISVAAYHATKNHLSLFNIKKPYPCQSFHSIQRSNSGQWFQSSQRSNPGHQSFWRLQCSQYKL